METIKMKKEWMEEIFNKFPSEDLEVIGKDRFDRFPEGRYISHSWAGSSGTSIVITPIFLINDQLVVGKEWENDIKEYSNNGSFGGEADNRLTIKDLISKEIPETTLLLGYHVSQEGLDYNEGTKYYSQLVVLRGISTLGDLAKEQHERSLKVFCNKISAAYTAETCKMVV